MCTVIDHRATDVGADLVDDGVGGKRSPDGPHRTPAGTTGNGDADGTGVGHDHGQIGGLQADALGSGDIAANTTVITDVGLNRIDHGIDRTGSRAGPHHAAAGAKRTAAGTGQGQRRDHCILRRLE